MSTVERPTPPYLPPLPPQKTSRKKKESRGLVILGMLIVAGFAFLSVATYILLVQHNIDTDQINILHDQIVAQNRTINNIANFLSNTQIPIDQVIIQNGTQAEKQILTQLLKR